MMRFVVRWLFRLFLVAIVLGVALILLKDTLLKSWIEHQLQQQAGMEARIAKFHSGLFAPILTIENLRLYNPAEFGGSPFIDVPELHLECDHRALWRGSLHFKLVRVEIAEMNIVEARTGQTNLVLDLEAMSLPAPSSGARKDQILGWDFEGIDVLNLTLGKIKYTSLRHPGRTADVQLGLKNEIITQIKSLEDLRNVLLTALFRHGITIRTEPGPAPRNRG